MSGIVSSSWSSRRPVSKAIIVPFGLRRTARGNDVSVSIIEDTCSGNWETMLRKQGTPGRTELSVVGCARALRGRRRSLRGIGASVFGNSSHLRGHLGSCSGDVVRGYGVLDALYGFADTGRRILGVRFGFALPIEGLAEPSRGVAGPRRNKRFRQNCLPRRAVLRIRC